MPDAREQLILPRLDQVPCVPPSPDAIPPREYRTSPEYEHLLTSTWTVLEDAQRNAKIDGFICVSETQAGKIIAYWQERLDRFRDRSSTPESIGPHWAHSFREKRERATWAAAYGDEALRFQADYLGQNFYHATLERGLDETERTEEIDGESKDIGKDYDSIAFTSRKNYTLPPDLYLTSLVGGKGKYLFDTKSHIQIRDGRIVSFQRTERSREKADEKSEYFKNFEGNISLSVDV